MMSRFNHAASVNSSRSASAFACRFISGDTRAFTTSVQFMSPNVTQKPLAGYPAFVGKRGRYSNRPLHESLQSLSQVVRWRSGVAAFAP
jgi:hypothetical protein